MMLLIEPVANGWIVSPYVSNQNFFVGDRSKIYVFNNFENMMAHIKTEAPMAVTEAEEGGK